jgi:hypothetical protein
MKSTLEFNLPEESIEHLDALHGHEWKSIVLDLYHQTRNLRKHGHKYEDADAAVEDFMDSIVCLVLDNGLSLD